VPACLRHPRLDRDVRSQRHNSLLHHASALAPIFHAALPWVSGWARRGAFPLAERRGCISQRGVGVGMNLAGKGQAPCDPAEPLTLSGMSGAGREKEPQER